MKTDEYEKSAISEDRIIDRGNRELLYKNTRAALLCNRLARTSHCRDQEFAGLLSGRTAKSLLCKDCEQVVCCTCFHKAVDVTKQNSIRPVNERLLCRWEMMHRHRTIELHVYH